MRENDLSDDYEKLPESELANRAAGGDEEAFGEIVRRYSPRVFRVAGKFFQTYGLIEEAAQEVFLRAFVQIESYEGRGSLEGWLTRVAVTTCLNLLRTAKRQPSLTFADLTVDETVWLEEKIINSSVNQYRSEEDKLIAADLIERLLRTLPAEDALVVTMIDGEGESIRTVAEMTGWSESKVKVRAFRARRRIREAVQKLLPENAEKHLGTEKTT